MLKCFGLSMLSYTFSIPCNRQRTQQHRWPQQVQLRPCSRQTCFGIALNKVGAVKNILHGQWDGHPTNIPTGGSPPLTTQWVAMGITAPMSPRGLWPFSTFFRGLNKWRSHGDGLEPSSACSFVTWTVQWHDVTLMQLNDIRHQQPGDVLYRWSTAVSEGFLDSSAVSWRQWKVFQCLQWTCSQHNLACWLLRFLLNSISSLLAA